MAVSDITFGLQLTYQTGTGWSEIQTAEQHCRCQSITTGMDVSVLLSFFLDKAVHKIMHLVYTQFQGLLKLLFRFMSITEKHTLLHRSTLELQNSFAFPALIANISHKSTAHTHTHPTWELNQQLRGHLHVDVLAQQAVLSHGTSFPWFQWPRALRGCCSPFWSVLAESRREAWLNLALGLGGWSGAQRFLYFGLFFQVKRRLERLPLVGRCSQEDRKNSKCILSWKVYEKLNFNLGSLHCSQRSQRTVYIHTHHVWYMKIRMKCNNKVIHSGFHNLIAATAAMAACCGPTWRVRLMAWCPCLQVFRSSATKSQVLPLPFTPLLSPSHSFLCTLFIALFQFSSHSFSPKTSSKSSSDIRTWNNSCTCVEHECNQVKPYLPSPQCVA